MQKYETWYLSISKDGESNLTRIEIEKSSERIQNGHQIQYSRQIKEVKYFLLFCIQIGPN